MNHMTMDAHGLSVQAMLYFITYIQMYKQAGISISVEERSADLGKISLVNHSD